MWALLALLPIGGPGPAPNLDPQSEARAFAAFLETVPECDRLYIRGVSTYDIPADGRKEFALLQRLAFRHLTLDPRRGNFPIKLPGANEVWWFDLRSFCWSDAAWRSVALRDKAFREPWIDNTTARNIRHMIGENQPGNFHVIGLVSAWGLYRRTYQTRETSDYYDLLFAHQRYVETGKVEKREVRRYWPGGIWPGNGQTLAAQWILVDVDFPIYRFVDFPANADEWLSAFLGGVSSTEYKLAIQRLKSGRGAVIKGMEDRKTNTSFVARNNREIQVFPLLTDIGAAFGRTFDVNKSSGKRDLEENAFTDQPRDKGLVFFDGGELLVSHPAGDALAALVINAQEKRLEEVPPSIAIHTLDSRDRAVRNGGLACMACHARAYGWIPAINTLEESTPDEVDVRFQHDKRPDKRAAEDYDAFFLNRQDRLKGSRDILRDSWLEATGSRGVQYKDGWSGSEFAAVSLAWKHKYDDPLEMQQMCLETGLPEEILRIAASRSVLRRSVDAARKAGVSRTAWDEDVFGNLMLIASSKKERVTP